MTKENQLQTNNAANNIAVFLNKKKDYIAKALPKHLNADRLIRIVMTTLQRTPKLLECSTESLYSAVMQSASLGLEPDGALGQAALVPYSGQVKFQIMYKGLNALAWRSGQLLSTSVHVVYEKDHFVFAFGLDEKLDHRPGQEADRGEIIYAYALVKLKGGGYIFDVMTKAEVDKVRDENSQAYKNAIKYKNYDTPWITHYPEMAKKTVFKRLSKYIPMAIELQRAVAIDDGAYQDDVVNNTLKKAEDLSDKLAAANEGAIEVEAEVVNEETGEITEPAKKTTAKKKAKPKPMKRLCFGCKKGFPPKDVVEAPHPEDEDTTIFLCSACQESRMAPLPEADNSEKTHPGTGQPMVETPNDKELTQTPPADFQICNGCKETIHNDLMADGLCVTCMSQ